MIDIGRSIGIENANDDFHPSAPEASLLFQQPSFYPDLSAGVCTRCSAPRQDCSAKFCFACEYQFDQN